jgi:hypothetical protein
MFRSLRLGGAVILLIAFTALIQAAFQAYRLRTGPNGWFEMQENLRRGSQDWPDRVVLIGGPYATKGACERDLGELKLDPFNAAVSCQQMLLSDAARLPGVAR